MLAFHQDQASQALPPPCQGREAAVQTDPPVVHPVPGQVQIAKPASAFKKLSVCKVQSTSIPPKPVHHPAVIRACLSMFSKKPGELNDEEIVITPKPSQATATQPKSNPK